MHLSSLIFFLVFAKSKKAKFGNKIPGQKQRECKLYRISDKLNNGHEKLKRHSQDYTRQGVGLYLVDEVEKNSLNKKLVTKTQIPRQKMKSRH